MIMGQTNKDCRFRIFIVTNSLTQLLSRVGSSDSRLRYVFIQNFLRKLCTRPSDDAIFFRREIIDAIKRSDEKMRICSKKADEKMDKFDEHGEYLDENR